MYCTPPSVQISKASAGHSRHLICCNPQYKRRGRSVPDLDLSHPPDCAALHCHVCRSALGGSRCPPQHVRGGFLWHEYGENKSLGPACAAILVLISRNSARSLFGCGTCRRCLFCRLRLAQGWPRCRPLGTLGPTSAASDPPPPSAGSNGITHCQVTSPWVVKMAPCVFHIRTPELLRAGTGHVMLGTRYLRR